MISTEKRSLVIFNIAILILGTILIISPASAATPTVSLYAVGGSTSSQLNTVEKYDPSTNTWSTVASMPTARGTLAAAVDSSGNIYAIGGASSVATGIGTVEKYNPSTNSWSTVASLLTGRWALAGVADFNGNIYAIGGMTSGGGPTALNTIEKYVSSTNTWSTVASMSMGRFDLSAAVDSSGNIYAIGGRDRTSTVVNIVEKYNPSTNTWSTVAPMPTARAGLAAAVDSSGNIYAIGGATSTVVNIVEKYNPSTNTWSTVAPMHTARTGLAAAVDSSGNIYAIGGVDSTNTVVNIVEKYDPSTNTWTTVASMPTARYALAAVGAQHNAMIPPTTVPPTTVPPTTVPPTTVPPTTVSPTTVPPTTVSPTTVPPTTVSPTTVPPTTVPPKAVTTPAKFRVGPSVTLRPVTDVIETNQDGIVELFMNNPSLNDVTLNVDARVSVPSGIHVYGESFGQAAGAGVVAGTFSVPPGTSRTITVVIKADKSARIGSHTMQFTGLYYPGDNKDNYQPLSLTYSVTVKEPSKKPEEPPKEAQATAPPSKIPGFGVVLAIFGVFAIARLLSRK